MQNTHIQFIVGCAIAVVIALGMYAVRQQHGPQSFVVDVGAGGDTNEQTAMYVDLGTTAVVGSDRVRDYRTAFVSPLYTHIRLAHAVNPSEQLHIGATLKTEAAVYYHVGCNTCGGADHGRAASGLLYDPRLLDYVRVQSFPEGQVYMRPEMVAGSSTNAESLADWLQAAGSENGVLSVEDQNNALANIAAINTSLQPDTAARTVPLHIRGAKQFVVFVADSLNVTITKHDLNWRAGVDTAHVSLAPFTNPDQSLGAAFIPDDGIANASKNVANDTTGQLTVENLAPGPYILSVVEDDLAQDGDFEIVDMTINTNKIMLSGVTTFLRGTTVYYNAALMDTLSLMIWTRAQAQTVRINGTPVKTLAAADINAWQPLTTPDSTSTLKTERALRIDTGSAYISLNGDGLFDPYIVQLAKTNPDVIITDSVVVPQADGWVAVQRAVPVTEAMEQWGIDEYSLQRTQRLDLWFTTNEMETVAAVAQPVTQAGSSYTPVYMDSHALIFAKDTVRDSQDRQYYSSSAEWLRTHIPARTEIGLLGDMAESTETTEVDAAAVDAEISIDATLKNTFSIMALTNGTLEVRGSVRTTSVAHAEVDMISATTGEVVEHVTVDVDSARPSSFAMAHSDLAPGVYRITLSCNVGDCITRNMAVTAAAAVFVDGVETVGESSWYTVTNGEDIGMTFPDAAVAGTAATDAAATTVTIDGTDYPLTAQQARLGTTVNLTVGSHTIAYSDSAHMTARYIAPTAETFFFPYVYDFAPFDTQEYVMMYSSIPSVAVDRVQLTLK